MATREQVNTDAPQVLANKTLASPIVSGGTLTNSQINNGTAGADPTAPLGLSTKQYVDQLRADFLALLPTTGDLKPTYKVVADPGWVLMDDGTIGNAGSGASNRANADTQALFTLLWNNVANQWAPVSGGRGANAAADFAANKTIVLPQMLGRSLACFGTGTSTASGVDADVVLAADTFAVPNNNAKWFTGMPVVFTLTSGTITPLVSTTTYYVIRVSSTTIQLATSLVNAQALTPIDLTAKSSPVWNLVSTFDNRALGEVVGEQAHAMNTNELFAHAHTTTIPRGNPSGNTLPRVSASGDAAAGSGVITSSTAGASAAMNILSPTAYANVMIKL